jgi:hypothetical protein
MLPGELQSRANKLQAEQRERTERQRQKLEKVGDRLSCHMDKWRLPPTALCMPPAPDGTPSCQCFFNPLHGARCPMAPGTPAPGSLQRPLPAPFPLTPPSPSLPACPSPPTLSMHPGPQERLLREREETRRRQREEEKRAARLAEIAAELQVRLGWVRGAEEGGAH